MSVDYDFLLLSWLWFCGGLMACVTLTEDGEILYPLSALLLVATWPFLITAAIGSAMWSHVRALGVQIGGLF